MLTFDRKKFWDAYHQNFGSVSQEQVDAIEFLLAQFEATARWSTIPQIAYALATIKHETADTFRPITERGARQYFNKYAPGTSIGKRLGNTEVGDGYRFRGRGYVQITGRTNYEKFGIVDDPDKALDPATAFTIMTTGMFTGAFTGKKLGSYVNANAQDYKNARRVINGQDQAALIAGYANDFEDVLTRSQVSAAVASKPELVGLSTTATANGGSTGSADDQASPADGSQAQPSAQSAADVVAVPQAQPQVDAAGQGSLFDRAEAKAAWFSGKMMSIPAAILSVVGTVWTYLTSAPLHLTLGILGAGTFVTSVYLSFYLLLKSTREKNAALIQAEELKLKAQREQQAHEITIKQMESAMRPDYNTVQVVPQPIKNSDVGGQ